MPDQTVMKMIYQTENSLKTPTTMLEPSMQSPGFSARSAMKGFVILFLLLCTGLNVQAQESEDQTVNENDYYQLQTLPVPDDIVLEVGGLTMTPNGKLAAATRRGEIWTISNPSMANGQAPRFDLFAQGLHETLGLEYRDGSLYTSQRGELTKLTDTDGDGKADLFENVYAWPISGHYHEYSYGPAFLPNGNMVVTGNVAFGDVKWWEGQSRVPWRGWTMIITPEGEMKPYATGMRSPSGIFANDKGDIFYTENQGDWIGSGFITHLEEGDFTGNPAGLRWADRPESPVEVRRPDIVDSERPLYETAERVPGVRLPSVWIPHSLMGISTTGIVQDTRGDFGPFKGHYFIGDQGHALINRVFMEKVKGEYQGAAFPFRKNFDSGVLRMVWGEEAAMYVGMTDRGWASTGEERHGLQRLTWTGKTPFEMKTIKATPDGFEIEFTQPVDKELAANPAMYNVTSFTYMYRYDYGSPIINLEDNPIKGLKVSKDGTTVRLVVDNLREKYIHEVKLGDIKSETGIPLLHDTGYYTLNNLPDGEQLTKSEWTASAAAASATSQVSSLAEAMDKEEEKGSSEAAASGPKYLTEMPESWEDGPDQSIQLGTKPGLKYDTDEIRVKAGSKVELVFNNEDDMLHNVVIVQEGTADDVGKMAMNLGLKGEQMNYVPETDKVLFHTSIVQPGNSEKIYFEIPSEPGTYTFVCTFPGHYISMRGTLVVE